MGGGLDFPLQLQSENNENSISQVSEGIYGAVPKAEQKPSQNETDQAQETSLEQQQAGYRAVLKAPQARSRSWNSQEGGEIRKRNIRGHEFAKLVDRYLAGEEIADILASIPEQQILVQTHDEELRMFQVEIAACLKLLLPDENDEDL